MSDLFEERDEVPTIEVRVFRHGELVHEERCESEEQAALVVDEWSDLDGVECEVGELSVHREQREDVESDGLELRDQGER